MTIKKVSLSLLAIAALSTTAFATDSGQGILAFTDSANPANIKSSFVIGTEYLKALRETNSSLDINQASGKVLTYKAQILADGAVSDANIIVDPFSGGSFDTNNIDYSKLSFVEVNATGDVVDIISDSASDDGNGGILFDSDSDKKIINGHYYRIVNSDDNGTISLPLLVGSDISSIGLELKVYSASGTVELRDDAKTASATEKPQYTISCDGKLDGMINFENGRTTFVPTIHGSYDQNNVDSLIFTVKNDAADIDYTLDENITFNIHGTDFNATAFDISGDNLEVLSKTDDGNVSFKTTNAPIPATTQYVLKFGVPEGVQIPEAKFYDYNATFENNVTVEPANYNKGADLGGWKDYTYVAQIPAATSDGHVESKLFIVNRNCSDAMPTFRVIYNGNVVTVPADKISGLINFTDDFKIARDTQGIVKVKDIVAAANQINPAIPTTGRYAIEVEIPGLAESWYVYAQAKNEDVGGQFKDLPVYNTSMRNY